MSGQQSLKIFIEESLQKLPVIIRTLNTTKKTDYAKQLKSLELRFYDPEFRLAIIGNFSCGKSTFLNALIKRELLSTDILPTTAIPTYIRWNKEALLKKTGRDSRRYLNPIITLTMNDGKIYSMTKEGKRAFEKETKIHLPKDEGNIIDTLTTTNLLIGKIQKTDLTFPERKGFENFCLIDTPGVNPGDEESKSHVLQTQRVLSQDADAIILLYSVQEAMARDTEKFLFENAGHLLEGAIIVITKIDIASKREVEKVIKNTTRLVKERFKQKEPRVYGISAQQAIEYFSGRSTDEADLKRLKDFDETVNKIIKHLSASRFEIISRRISDLMRTMINSIFEDIAEELSDLEKESECLEKASVVNLEKEFEELHKKYFEKINYDVNVKLQIIREKIYQIVATRRENFFIAINSADNSEQLNKFIEDNYSNIMAGVEDEIIEEIKKNVSSPLNEDSKSYSEKVEECLNKYQRYLGAVNTKSTDIKKEGAIEVRNTTPPKVEDSFLSNHAGKIAAAALTVFTGGLGTVLVFLGGWLLDGYRFNSKKNEVKEKIRKNLSNYEQSLTQYFDDEVVRIFQENLDWSKNLLTEYTKTYKTQFDEIERLHNERVVEVETKINRDKENIQRIEDLKKMAV